jgi:hypothetical protein
MKYIYMPQAPSGLLSISYVVALLRTLLHVNLISMSHIKTSNYQ